MTKQAISQHVLRLKEIVNREIEIKPDGHISHMWFNFFYISESPKAYYEMVKGFCQLYGVVAYYNKYAPDQGIYLIGKSDILKLVNNLLVQLVIKIEKYSVVIDNGKLKIPRKTAKDTKRDNGIQQYNKIWEHALGNARMISLPEKELIEEYVKNSHIRTFTKMGKCKISF